MLQVSKNPGFFAFFYPLLRPILYFSRDRNFLVCIFFGYASSIFSLIREEANFGQVRFFIGDVEAMVLLL